MFPEAIRIVDKLPRHPKKKVKRRKRSHVKFIVLHCSQSNNQSITAQARYHTSKQSHLAKGGAPTVAYTEHVKKNGKCFKSLDYDEIGYHAGNFNKKALGLCLMYKAQNKQGVDIYRPPAIQLTSALKRSAKLCLEFNLTPAAVVGHRELKGTGWLWHKGSKKYRKTCPGMLIDMDTCRKRVAKYMQEYLKSTGYLEGKVDGIFGPKSKAALAAHTKAMNSDV